MKTMRADAILSKISRLSAGPDESPGSGLQRTVLLSTCLIGMVVTVLWAMMYFLFGEALAAWISLLYTLITLGVVWQFIHTHNFHLLLYIQLTLGLVLPFLQMLALGGFVKSGVVILWSLTSPLGALLLIGPRQVLRWWLAFLLLVILAGLLEPVLRPASLLPAWLVTGLFAANIIAVTSLMMVVLIYFVNQKNLAYELLSLEQEKAERLLLNVLPKEIAAILKIENRTIAERFESASILFADLVGFTELSAILAPEEMVNLLNEIFSYFDSLVDQYDVEKIRTIGDNYMVASGVPRPRPDHAQALARVALEMDDYIRSRPPVQGRRIEFRIGINSGPVIGGVIGRRKFAYDVWGDTVNVASRMESHGLPGKIQVSPSTYDLIQGEYLCEPRGKLMIKGKGEMETWIMVR